MYRNGPAYNGFTSAESASLCKILSIKVLRLAIAPPQGEGIWNCARGLR